MKRCLRALGACLAAAGSIVCLSEAADSVETVTRADVPIESGAGNSLLPVMTPDGRFVVFVSHANNLVTNDNFQPYSDIFVRDRLQGTTTLVSVDRFGTRGGDGNSGYPSISENGRFVLFVSDANLFGDHGTINRINNVFMRDLHSGTTTLVSVTISGQSASAPRPPAFSSFLGSSKPIMTPDAQWVTFESIVDNLVSDDTNAIADIFLRDMRGAVTRLVSLGAQPIAGGRGASHSPSMADDGSRVAFVSTAGNLVPGRTNRNGDIYVRDFRTTNTVWAGSNLVAHFGYVAERYRSFNPAISSDGRYVAFKVAPVGDELVRAFVHDLDTSTTILLATNTSPNTFPAWSANGRWLAFEESNNVYLRDMPNATNLLVSANLSGTSHRSGISQRPVLTPDGLHVAFVSSATGLVSNEFSSPSNHFAIYVRAIEPGITRLVNVATNGWPGASSAEHVLPAISADGQFVAFDTAAEDLVPDDNNRSCDVFVRNVFSSATELISARHATKPQRTGVQSAAISSDSISADGRFLAFSSMDDSRVPSDTNRQHDIFLRDLLTGSLSWQSRAPNDLFPGSFDPLISGNGDALIFLRQSTSLYSSATRLFWTATRAGPHLEVESFVPNSVTHYAAISPDGSTVVFPRSDLFWTNMITGSNGIITLDWEGRPAAGFRNRDPVFSPNGRFVAFVSDGQLLPNVMGTHVYIRDMQSNVTFLASVDSNGLPLGNASEPGKLTGAFSGNTRYLTFYITHSPPRIYRYDLESRRTVLVCTNCTNPSISADGQLIAFNTGFPHSTNVYVADVESGVTHLVSRTFLGSPALNGTVGVPSLSANGRFVVFDSTASNLVFNDANNASDVFVHDRLQGATMLISRSRFGARSASGISSKPVMSADGRTVVFQSFAHDLVEGDYNERRDIFVLRLGSADSDNDGLDDDWEAAFFGDLSQSGNLDYDGDGSSNVHEFLAGTDPTNSGSIFRVLTVTSTSDGVTMILWNSVPGRIYVVQFKDSLEAADWTNASGLLTGNVTTMSFTHGRASPQRFYRVIALQ